MKILFVIDTYDTNNNGTSISAQRFAAELRRRGHEVKILTSGEPGEDRFALPTYKMPIFQPLMDKHNFNFAYSEKKPFGKPLNGLTSYIASSRSPSRWKPNAMPTR